MTAALLCLASLAQPDIHFARIVEDWVIAASPKRIDALLNSTDARLVRVLGSPDYEARELAQEVIAARGHSAFRLLCVGVRHRDPEIANRSARLLHELYRCRVCGGDGRCKADIWHASESGLSGWHEWCAACERAAWRLTGKCQACRGEGFLDVEPEREDEW
jgi:hypothetical protein